jgi:hypothetical protein
VPHRGPGIGVRGSFLYIAERHAGIQRCGDERVPQGMRANLLSDPGTAGHLADDPPGAMTVQPPAAGSEEDGSLAALAGRQVNRPRGPRRERDRHDLAALAGDHQGPVAPLDAQCFDIRAGSLGDPQPVEGQQRDQRVLGGRPEPRGDQQRAELVAVQSGRVRLMKPRSDTIRPVLKRYRVVIGAETYFTRRYSWMTPPTRSCRRTRK